MEERQVQAQLCRWFVGILARELTAEQLVAIRSGQAAALIDGLRYFVGDSAEIGVLSDAMMRLADEDDCEIRLASDYAALFLMPGRESAPPFASCYAEPGLLFGPPHREMQQRLVQGGLGIQGSENMPADHIAIMLEYLACCYEGRVDTDSPEHFIASALSPWVAQFAARASKSPAGDRLYGPLCNALIAFLHQDGNISN